MGLFDYTEINEYTLIKYYESMMRLYVCVCMYVSYVVYVYYIYIYPFFKENR